MLFFTRGKTEKGNTKNIWFYDLRSEMPSFGKTNPLKIEHFAEFEKCYCPDCMENREETYSEENPNGRWRKFTLGELLDQIKQKSLNIATAVAELEKLISEVEE